MKWLAFFGMLTFGVPAMIGLSHASGRARRLLFAALMISTCVKISVNFLSHEWYRGPDRGFEVTLTDLIALALGISLLLRKPRKLFWIPPTAAPMAAFFALALVSVQLSEAPLYGWFSLFKLLKAFWLYWVIYNTFVLEAPEVELWWGVVGIAYYETFVCLKQKYLHGLYRVYGTFDHSNSIPIYLLMTTPMLLAWLLHGKHMSRWRTAMTLVAIAGCCFCTLATQSRAGMVLMGASLIAVAIRVVPHQMDRRKLALACLMLLVTCGGVYKAWPTIVRRFQEAPQSSFDARTEFNRAAYAMSQDYTFGVGYNLFSHAMTHHDEYKRYAEVMEYEKQAGVCHHIYYLTAAETGMVGLAAFLCVLGAIHWRLFRRLWGPPTFERCLVIGLFVGLSAVHVTGFLEWCVRLTPTTNMFMIAAAIGQAYCMRIAAAESSRKRARRRARSYQPSATPAPARLARAGAGSL